MYIFNDFSLFLLFWSKLNKTLISLKRLQDTEGRKIYSYNELHSVNNNKHLRKFAELAFLHLPETCITQAYFQTNRSA